MAWDSLPFYLPYRLSSFCHLLRSPADRGCLLHLLFAVLRQWGIHWALPCTKNFTLGGQTPDDFDTDLADFVIDGLEHSAAAGCHASFRARAPTAL